MAQRFVFDVVGVADVCVLVRVVVVRVVVAIGVVGEVVLEDFELLVITWQQY